MLHDLYMLDVHVANKCNLHCDGCNHWSNYNFSEVFTNNTLEEWAIPWSKRLNPERINLLGGEPFLNKECKEIVYTYGYNAKPYKDNDKRKSWEECVSKNSIQLYNGLLHKCGPITYLKDFLKKYNLQNDEDWVNYYNYMGLSPNCTDKSLKDFLSREEEDICKMCPAHPNKVSDKEIFKLTEN
jgi:hypothetical protein